MQKWLADTWLQILAIALVIGAVVFTAPYAYYQLTNWAVMLAALMIAWRAYTQKVAWAVPPFVFVAILFNPIEPIYLRSDVWQLADIAVALLFAASMYLLRK